jgi:arylsulfatase
MMYMRRMTDNMWPFVPIQAKVQVFLSTIGDCPFQEGQSLNATGIDYQALKALQVLKQLNEKGVLSPITN